MLNFNSVKKKKFAFTSIHKWSFFRLWRLVRERAEIQMRWCVVLLFLTCHRIGFCVERDSCSLLFITLFPRVTHSLAFKTFLNNSHRHVYWDLYCLGDLCIGICIVFVTPPIGMCILLEPPIRICIVSWSSYCNMLCTAILCRDMYYIRVCIMRFEI